MPQEGLPFRRRTPAKRNIASYWNNFSSTPPTTESYMDLSSYPRIENQEYLQPASQEKAAKEAKKDQIPERNNPSC
jgi:hypothetical protein